MGVLNSMLRAGERRRFKSFEERVRLINLFEAELDFDSDEDLRERFSLLRERARAGENLDDLQAECFACVREAAKRALGMRPFDVQLIGAMALHDGAIAEMRTGEGKTLTATLAVSLNALAGQPVHVVTVNDYLARRDAEWMKPVYQLLGLNVGVIQTGQLHDERRAAYAADVTYGTNSELGFDYLRDNLTSSIEERVQRGHAYGIVDEVDSILIDEARTPLIISGQAQDSPETYRRFAQLAKRLKGIPQKDRPSRGPLAVRIADEEVVDYDYEYDEKHKTIAISERGVAHAERFLKVAHLYQAEHGALINHLAQALKAQSLYKRDVDYAVIDGQIKIIDEFTGRILEGRRWSEGLHQAVEAKERVAIEAENHTIATITYQNYFRRYTKLAGMTGTALTEAAEFMKIYDLEVVEIPTHRPMIRVDEPDRIYKSRQGKWAAVITEIIERNRTGQPVLVGTISVEASEELSRALKRKSVDHAVLNARPEHAQREGETIAQAGRPGAVTIATNMAGRGVDIKLGGSEEHLIAAECARRGITSDDDPRRQQVADSIREQVESDRQKVLDAGGLYILGTERHESRRIDNQLRGRAGRQGDPGRSCFFISAEDDLIRLFAGEKVYKLLDALGPVDDDGEEIALQAKVLSKQIERAQRTVEEQNFLIRKRVLEYDDVLNQQREVIYGYRDRILRGEDLSELIETKMVEVIESTCRPALDVDYVEDWDQGQLQATVAELSPKLLDQQTLDELTIGDAQPIIDRALEFHREQRERWGEETVAAIERFGLLQIIDRHWQEHLADMDYLREGIGLRSFAQIDPLVAYKNEGFSLFGEMVDSIWQTLTRYLLRLEIALAEEPAPLQTAAADQESVRAPEKLPGRNQPCWCGSEKKYKHCHGR